MTAADLAAFRPATDLLIGHLAETLAEMRAHEHPERGDLFCLNLSNYVGERMGPVLRRLADEQAETRKWQEKNTALADEFTAEADRLHAERDELKAALAEILAMAERFDTPRDSSRVRVFIGDLKHLAHRGLTGAAD